MRCLYLLNDLGSLFFTRLVFDGGDNITSVLRT